MSENERRPSPQPDLDDEGGGAMPQDSVRPSEDGRPKRTATVYDAVAGRVGISGFLTAEQGENHKSVQSAPEDVLLRRTGAPDEIPYGYYDADDRLSAEQNLPDSDLLKAIHEYASDFYNAMGGENGGDFRSFDETALLALGILLEEASREVLGENGDMAMVEPAGLEHDMLETNATRHQVLGRVNPRKLSLKAMSPADESSDELAEEASPRKKRRAAYKSSSEIVSSMRGGSNQVLFSAFRCASVYLTGGLPEASNNKTDIGQLRNSSDGFSTEQHSMAPKTTLSQAQKLEKIVAFFHNSATCHTFKDLEVSLPAATKINKMQIKDLVKELTDTNQVKVEKIGSGNWYWAWADEEVAEKQSLQASLRVEHQEIEQSVRQIQKHVLSLKTQRSEDLDRPDYDRLLAETNTLDTEIKALTVKGDEWEHAVAGGIGGKRHEVDEKRLYAIRQTDNIYALEAYLLRQLSVSSEELEMIRRDCYGPLYQSDNDLTQLDES